MVEVEGRLRRAGSISGLCRVDREVGGKWVRCVEERERGDGDRERVRCV
jgi:hypothetical protein